MRTLLLLRHAKSSWDNSSLPDFDRPLAERGERDAPRIGKELAQRGPLPDLVVSSTALRAVQTANAATKAAGYTGQLNFDEQIYGASSAELIKIVRKLPDDHSKIMLVGHNPGFEDLLSRLIDERQSMSTCNLACIEFSVSKWSDVEDGQGKLRFLLKPREL